MIEMNVRWSLTCVEGLGLLVCQHQYKLDMCSMYSVVLMLKAN